MKYKFQISDYLILLLLFINFYISTILPGMFIVKNYVFLFNIAISLFIMLIAADPVRLNLSWLKPNLFVVTTALLVISFGVSAFVVNIGEHSGLRTLSKLFTYFTSVAVFFIYLGKKFTNNELVFDKYAFTLMSAGIVLSVIALIMFTTGIGTRTEYSFSAHGLFVHPNSASFMFIIVIPICIYFYTTGRLSAIVFGVIAGLFAICLLLTFSRAGYIGAITSVLLFLFLRSNKKLIFTLSALVIIAVGLNFIMDFVTAKQDSSFGRFLLAMTAANMIMETSKSFLWGSGVFRSLEIFREEKAIFGSYEFVDDPHNFLLLLGIQFGVIVTALSVIVVALILVRTYFADKKNLSHEEISRIYLSVSIVCGLIINNMFEDIIVYPEFYVMPVFLMFLGYLHYKTLTLKNGK